MKTTDIHIRVTETATRTESVRKRVSIPHTDLWTQEWWNAQQNPSASVRRLIHEETRQHGVGDLLDRLAAPVAAAPATAAAPTPASTPVPTHVASSSPWYPGGPSAPAAPAATSVVTTLLAGDPRDIEIAELRRKLRELTDAVATFQPFLSAFTDEPSAAAPTA